MIEAIASQAVAQLAANGLEKTISWVLTKFKEQGTSGCVKQHTFSTASEGLALIKISGISKPTEAIVLWGPWVRKFSLPPKQEQFVVLRKGTDIHPLTLLLTGPAHVDFSDCVVDITGGEWLQAG